MNPKPIKTITIDYDEYEKELFLSRESTKIDLIDNFERMLKRVYNTSYQELKDKYDMAYDSDIKAAARKALLDPRYP